ncbi:MAG: dynamin family protein [Gammaproteobacteria bacterium]|nr:dynamin family protein [Pseudomonadales bacterium]MCP5347409.1 dynamin family protein [Pseudomonadales bacterium]
MKTEVQRFCELFTRELDPFGQRLDRAVGALTGQLGRIELDCLKQIRSNLRDIRHRYVSLQEKIENQQAYLLIFGPLKSGKSTLMNAISGAYVSEVSSLPSYPSLVYVKDGIQPRFQATDYTGEIREFEDGDQLCESIRQEHRRLAETIEKVESTGQEFDPARHLPEAIKRVNVEIPAQPLADSGTVLIDTPGLYTHMKFGYDQMTRELRNTAACAIFVVKTDNLFFEKVFEEFKELLNSYGRIFLITNIDSSKQDLQKDGSLAPSLESSDPDQVIEAFRSLSMNTTLRRAMDDGRLNIYPIDLLKAASRRLSASEQHQAADDADEYESSDAVYDEFNAETGDGGFNHFLQDLTDYLNSNEYIQDFMADSLKLAGELGLGTIELATSEAAGQLLDSCVELRATIEKKQKQTEAIDRVEELDWSASFTHLDGEKDQLLESLSQDHSRLEAALEKALSEWMDTDDSWLDLLNWHLKNTLEQEVRRDAGAIIDHFRPMLGGYSGGARLNMFQMGRLHQAGLRIEDSVPQLLRELGEGVVVHSPSLNLHHDEVPVKRTLLDLVMFRKKPKVLEKFFGRDGDLIIPAKKKRKRLAGGGEAYLKEQLQKVVREQLPTLQRNYIDQVLGQYRFHFTRTIQQRAAELRVAVRQEVSDCREQLRARMQVVGILEGAKASAQKFTSSLGWLQEEFDIRIHTVISSLQGRGGERDSTEDAIKRTLTPAQDDVQEQDLESVTSDLKIYPLLDSQAAAN